jgi:rod shape-determining protein MreC
VWSIGLTLLDHFFHGRNLLKQSFSSISKPVYNLVDMPGQTSDWIVDWFNDRRVLSQALEQLELENAILKVKLQQLQADLNTQNTLQSFAVSTQNIADEIISADILNVNLERYSQRIVLNKGQSDHIYLGQPVVDQFGIVGQITDLAVAHSIVTLITDASQSTPVLVKRNGLRALVNGTGHLQKLDVKYQGAEADINIGDHLISSGIGDRFPPGYPVAVVDDINSDDNESFLQITAKPLAKLNHGKQLLLIWPRVYERTPNPHQDSVLEEISMIDTNRP